MQSNLGDQQAVVHPRIESVLGYDLDEAKQADGDTPGPRLTLPIAKAFILNAVAPAALAVLDRRRSLFRVSIAANTAQFVMGDVLSVETIHLQAQWKPEGGCVGKEGVSSCKPRG